MVVPCVQVFRNQIYKKRSIGNRLNMKLLILACLVNKCSLQPAVGKPILEGISGKGIGGVCPALYLVWKVLHSNTADLAQESRYFYVVYAS